MSYLFLKTNYHLTPFLFCVKLVDFVDDEEIAIVRYLTNQRKNFLNKTRIETKNMSRKHKQVRKSNLRKTRQSKSSATNNKFMIPISACGEHFTFVLIHWYRLVSKKITDWRPVTATQFDSTIVRRTLWTIFVKTLCSLAEVQIPIKNQQAIQKYALMRSSLEMFQNSPTPDVKKQKRRARDLVRLWCFFDRELLKNPPK